MKHLLLIFATAAAMLLSGCVTSIPLQNIQYTGIVGVTSSKTAKVQLVSDVASASPVMLAGKISVPISTGPVPQLQFHTKDQRASIASLRKELVRLGMFKSTVDESTSEPTDISISIIFEQTHHNVEGQEYTLDLEMQLTGGDKPFVNQYRVISSVKDSTWDKWNTTAYDGKKKAVKRLLEKLIPDIESYIATASWSNRD